MRFLVSLCIILAVPIIAGAAPLVPECPEGGCGFPELIQLANNLIQFLVIQITVPVAAIVFAIAGFKYVTAAGNESQIREATGMFSKVVIGLIIALSAFLIVELITSNLFSDDVNDLLDSQFISE